MRRWILTSALVLLVLGLIAFAQDKPKEKKPQQPCPDSAKVFVLEPDQVAEKVKELNAQGYCISKGDFLVVGKQVLLFTGDSDLYGEEEEDPCESGKDCEH